MAIPVFQYAGTQRLNRTKNGSRKTSMQIPVNDYEECEEVLEEESDGRAASEIETTPRFREEQREVY